MLYSVDFVDKSTGWAVGSVGTILHSDNGGSTWTAQTSGTTNALLAVDFFDGARGYAVGDLGTVVRFTGVVTPVVIPGVTPWGIGALAVVFGASIVLVLRRRPTPVSAPS